MEENDVIGMEDTQIDGQPTFEHEPTLQAEDFEINTQTTNMVAPVSVPELEPIKTNEDLYNSQTSLSPSIEDEKELGSCDCRSECKYNTGKTWKSSDFGYSD